MKEISFSDIRGNKLLGVLSIPKQSKSVVIMSHGFASNKNSKLYVELENDLNSFGIGTFRFDYYGHGELYCKGYPCVTKDTTLSKSIDSLNAAISYVHKLDNYNIGLIGSSFGGLISIISASQNSRIKALALKSPVTEPVKFWKERLGNEKIKKWEQKGILHYDDFGEKFELEYGFWEDVKKFNTLEMAKQITCPILIVHGDEDTVVPIKLA